MLAHKKWNQYFYYETLCNLWDHSICKPYTYKLNTLLTPNQTILQAYYTAFDSIFLPNALQQLWYMFVGS